MRHCYAGFCCMHWLGLLPPLPPSFPCCVASPSNGCLSILRFNDWPLAAPHTVYALRWRKRSSVCKVYCQQHNSMKSKYMVLKLLLVFSVTPFKIDQNKKSKPFNRLSPESGNRKKIHMQSLSPRFRSQQFFSWKICEETFSPNL